MFYSKEYQEIIYDYIVELNPEMKSLIEYVKEIKPAKKYEIINLQEKIRTGSKVARLRLIKIHIPVAIRLGFKFARQNELDVADVIQDAIVFMIEALDKYVTRRSSFKSGVYQYIKKQLEQKYLENQSENKVVISDIIIQKESIYKDIEEQLLNQNVHLALKVLTPKEEEVIRLRFGFDDGKPMSLEEVARDFGVTQCRAREIEAKAIRKLHSRRCLALFVCFSCEPFYWD